MREPVGAAEGHATNLRAMLHQPHREVAAAAADRSRRLRERHPRGTQDRPAVALAERRELLDLLDCMEREPGERGLAVERELGPAEFGRHPRGHLRQECLAKLRDPVFLHPQARRRRMAAAGQEQLAAGHERGVHVEARHAPHASRGHEPLMSPLGDHHDRAVIPLGQSPRHDADDSRVPAAVGQHERRVGLRIELLQGLLRGCEQDAPLLGLAASVELVHVACEALGPGHVGRGQQLDPLGCLAEPAGRVEPRGQTKGDIFAFERPLLVQARELEQLGEPRPAPLPQALEAAADDDPVLVHQRHDVGHGAERGQADPAQEHLAEPGRDLLRATGPRGDRPGELEGHARAAQLAEGIGRAR